MTATKQVSVFTLKCPVCGKKGDKPASECRGSDSPTCDQIGGRCYGIPLMVEKVSTKRVAA